MEYIIGGCSKGSDLIVENAIKYFEERFSKPVEFEGIIENDYFIGIIKVNCKKVLLKILTKSAFPLIFWS